MEKLSYVIIIVLAKRIETKPISHYVAEGHMPALKLFV
jgi:hypothetical protein